MSVRVLVLAGYGINCEEETAAAFGMAGAETRTCRVADLLEGRERLRDYRIVVLPGGFSFGDDLGSGRVLAQLLRRRKDYGGRSILSRFEELLGSGGMVLGICNGFQVLVALGLLPQQTRAALTFNASGRFENRWARVKAAANSSCAALRELGCMHLPCRHGEGRLVFEGPEALQALVASGQACLHFVDASGERTERYPDNPNGSPLGVTGLCDASGRVLGLMPHPEAALSLWNHPDWPARLRKGEGASGEGDGAAFFRSLIGHVH